MPELQVPLRPVQGRLHALQVRAVQFSGEYLLIPCFNKQPEIMVCSWLCAISFCHCSTVLPSSSWFLNTFISGSVILQRDAKIQTSIFLIVNFPVLHRLREALPKRRQVWKGAGLLQEGAARPPPEKLPILPPRQGARGFAKPARGEHYLEDIIKPKIKVVDEKSRLEAPNCKFLTEGLLPTFQGNVEFRTDCDDVYATCPVQVMKEIEDDLVDAPCGEMTLHGHAGYCK